MSDIVERLREQGEWRSDKAWDGCPIAEEAAKEITHLREENARLQGLLREAHVKMDANNLWSNLRHRVAVAIREGGKNGI